jgi:hypothetical protein
VACRKVYEGKVVTMPAPAARRFAFPVRWAVAAVVVLGAGTAVWFAFEQSGRYTGPALIKTINGTLYAVTDGGIRPLAAGQNLPDGVELRTAKDSDAMLQLRDGSFVELRERSGLSTADAGSDVTVRLIRGSVIVQAAKRRSGHLYVATPDCRVSVTGTVFSVSAGVKGSRVSVVQGEVRVSQDNQESVLHPGEQHVTTASLEPVSVRDDIAWSRNRDKLIEQLNSLRAGLDQLHLPALRYSSKLLGRLPADTMLFASIPNLAQYLADVQSVFNQKMAESPELRSMWASRGASADAFISKLRAASEYLGDEIVIAAAAGPNGQMQAPVFLSEARRDGFAAFLQHEIPPAVVENHSGVLLFGPDRAAVTAMAQTLDAPPGFQATPFYTAIEQSYREGAGMLLCFDLTRLPQAPIAGARYFIAGQKEVNGQMETRATLAFQGARTGIAAWLASPSPMGALDYISPDATFLTAFVVKNPAAIVDELVGIQQRSPAAAEKGMDQFRQETGVDVRADLAASLGGEFALAVDGPVIPVPSWKLITEVYDPSRVEYTLRKVVEAYNQSAAKAGRKPLRTSQETFEGRTYYMIAGADPNPLTEAHYTFSDGYMVAGPSRAIVSKALATKAAGTSITHSASFLAMTPRDHYSNFSAVMYQNLGTTLAPIAGLLGAFAPSDRNTQNAIQGLGKIKPVMFALYGEPDRITFSGNSSGLGGFSGILGGNLANMVGSALPLGSMLGGSRHGGAVPFAIPGMAGTPRR